MPPSRLDALYRRMLITKFFEKGWGEPENLKRLFEFRKIVSNRELCYKLIPKDYPVEITKEEKTSDYHVIEGKFVTPLELYLPGLVPKAAQEAHFQMLLPLTWADENYKPVCVHFAGTGDHYFWRRRNFIAKPLLREAGIGAIILENPFYGVRKPKEQVRSNLNNVSDIFVMGGCLVLENLVLLHWCEKHGLGPLGVTGLSMGGHMASLSATNWPKPLVLVPCLSWSTASSVFTQGVMSQSINWDRLETQYYADGHYRERLAKMVTIVDDAFVAGQHFIQNFNESMNELQKDITSVKHMNIQPPATNPAFPEEKNTFNLSEPLLEKLQSVENPINLSTDEVQELNKKILIAQGKDAPPPATDVSAENYVNDTIRVAGNALSSATTKLMSLILPDDSSTKHTPIDITKTKWWEREALQFMRGMMDECTHLKNFSVPYDTTLITAICAKDDAYVPREGCTSLEEIWPGAVIKYLDAGHVSAYVLHQKLFR
ncbi:Protein ABHD18 [Pseudolycoriella hygida]|uniref:Protein ABHD18 n=1 Tax=Pseudolycoriella hygida TaxID=35572 RepID=A0A9Q0NC84_9DIPT|nr:Protein ABHD18 [Pseudolycoriella hygida]